MIRYLLWLLARLTGGRPMTRHEALFRDMVNGATVYRFEDLFGRQWMAEGQYDLFRVPLRDEEPDEESVS